MKFLYVFIGGGLGSVCRYILGKWFNEIWDTLPLGTLIANVLGSFIIGLLISFFALRQGINQLMILLFTTGFCGGFTTFSTFSYENIIMLKNGNSINFLIYFFGSIILSFIAIILGIEISKWLFKIMFNK